MRKTLRVAAIGELLWDLLPDGPQLGGAPANFAAILAQMSACAAGSSADEVFLVTSVGDDPLGVQAREQLMAHRVLPDFIAVDRSHPTGTVDVLLDASHGPQYRIRENVAWDYVAETSQVTALAPTLDAICFGTLAQRAPVTRATLRSLVAATRADCLRVFDVNLRPPDWNADAIAWGCAHATILKMNLDEIAHVAHAVGVTQEQTSLQAAHSLLDRFPIHLVAITRGPHGSLLVTREAVHDHPGIPAHVADSIGAGDCFTAALTYCWLRRSCFPVLAEAANRWGAWAASQPGGMPFLDGPNCASLETSIEQSENSQSYPDS
ncbi:MAG: PfkB family carbohydrate kinase [Acidobacteriaceae bacterium]